MNGSLVTARFTPGAGTWTRPTTFATDKVVLDGDHRITDVGLPSGDPSSISETKADAEAAGRFHRNLRSKLTAFEGGVFVGELAQTLSMIRNPAKGLRGLVDEFRTAASAVRRRALRPRGSTIDFVKSVNGHLADLWLEYQFGWKPLLHDIDGGCHALALINTGQSLHTGRITASYTDLSSPSTSVVPNSESFANWIYTLTSINNCLVVYRGAIRADALDPKLMEARLLGFDPSSFLPTAWELVPYSFLIDYFSNIGDIILGWSQIGVQLSWSNKTVKKFIAQTTVSSPHPGQTPTSFSPAKFVTTKSVVSRQKYEGVSTPGFTLRVPGSGSLRWLNIAALIAGRSNDRKWRFD
jgi:hypothetical protein